jgi:hypothetical protein
MRTQGLIIGSLSLTALLLVGCDDRLKTLLEAQDLLQKGSSDSVKAPPEKVDPSAGKPADEGKNAWQTGTSVSTKTETTTAPSLCTAQGAGSPTTCETSATWKKYATDTCEKAGMQVTRADMGDECGENSFRFIKFECCKLEPATPEPSSCTAQGEGSPTTCETSATWKKYATDTCAKAGMQVTQLDMGDECGENSFRFIKFECCKSQSPTAEKGDLLLLPTNEK